MAQEYIELETAKQTGRAAFGKMVAYLKARSSVPVKLPAPPFTPEEKKLVGEHVYAHVWQQAMSGGFASAA